MAASGGWAAAALAAVTVERAILALQLGDLSPHPVTARATLRIGSRRGLLRSVAVAAYWLLFSNLPFSNPLRQSWQESFHAPRGGA